MKDFLKNNCKKYIPFLVMVTCYVISLFYFMRGVCVILDTEVFWPGFGHVLFACPIFTIAVAFEDYIDKE